MPDLGKICEWEVRNKILVPSLGMLALCNVL